MRWRCHYTDYRTKRTGLSIVSGLIGLWAVCASNARAAKVYMWTLLPRWFMRFVAQEIRRHIMYNSLKPYGLEETVAKGGRYALLFTLADLIWTVYGLKVKIL